MLKLCHGQMHISKLFSYAANPLSSQTYKINPTTKVVPFLRQQIFATEEEERKNADLKPLRHRWRGVCGCHFVTKRCSYGNRGSFVIECCGYKNERQLCNQVLVPWKRETRGSFVTKCWCHGNEKREAAL